MEKGNESLSVNFYYISVFFCASHLNPSNSLIFLFFCCCLQNVVSKSALQFKGNSQHDAQEFLLWLLDRVHEDLNQIVPLDSRLPRKVNTDLDHSYVLPLCPKVNRYATAHSVISEHFIAS